MEQHFYNLSQSNNIQKEVMGVQQKITDDTNKQISDIQQNISVAQEQALKLGETAQNQIFGKEGADIVYQESFEDLTHSTPESKDPA